MLRGNMINQSIECVIFDCDGVLIDSEILSGKILIEQLATVGVHVDFPYVQTHFLGRSWVKIVDEMRKSYGLDLGDAFENGYRNKLLEVFETELKPVDGVQDVLRNLSVPFCVATSSSPRRVARSLQIVGLTDFFGSHVFTASQVKKGKPAPDLFLHAANKMGVKPKHCLVIEDSLPGIQAAKAANMIPVRFMGGSHLSGQLEVSRNALAPITHFDKWQDFFSISPTLKK